MWETFISWYINTYLGKYVENLNSQQLSFALRQGELELENVPLKKNIFRSWGLPIEVRSGVVGRIRIEFNILKYFRNEPVLVFIEDVYLVAGPLNLSEWDPVEEEILCHEAKMSALDGHEARWKAHNDLASNESSYYSTLYFSSMRIGASIVTKVVENLQLQVRNVHIRFEDDIVDSRNRVMAIGITLESLTAQSCDSQWNPLSSVHDRTFESSYKTLQLNKFGIYCDTRTERFSHYKPQELKDMMCKLLTSHEYILHPVSAEARIAKNNSTNPLPTSSKARFDVHLTLEKVPLNLSDSQFRQSYLASKAFRKLERNCRLRHYRPFVQVKGTQNVKEWWKYALRAILTIRGYKIRKILKTWDEILKRGQDNVAYVNTYEQHLQQELLSGDMQKLKDRVETELHFEEIIILREIAIGRVEVTNTKSSSSQPPDTTSQPVKSNDNNGSSSNPTSPTTDAGQSQGLLGWVFPSWSSWLSSSESTSQLNVTMDNEITDKNLDDELSPVKNLSSSDMSLSESKLHQSEMDFDEAILDDMKAFGRDALLGRFHFILKQGSVTLKKKTGPFLEFEFTGVDLRTELRPRSGSHKFQMSLSSVFLRDCSTNSLIISAHTPSSGKPGGGLATTAKELLEPLFRLSYERKSQQKTAHRVSVTTKPLDLVLYPILWEDVRKYFTVNSKQDELEIPHSGGYEAMKQRTREEIRTYWERLINQHSENSLGGGAPSWDIVMNISAPQIVVHGAKESRSNIKKMYSKINASPSTYRQEGSTKKFDTLTGGSYRSSSFSPVAREVEPFLVIDLGRFRFTNLSESELLLADEENSSSKAAEQACKNSMCNTTKLLCSESYDDSYSDNEEFLTPCSSPVPEMASPQSCVNSPRASISDISEAPTIKSPTDEENDATDGFGDLHNKLYKKYSLEITDVQVIVVEGKSVKDGNWRSAVARGTSPLHLVDKFSINLQLERRLIYSEDPLWPALTLVATLPNWNLHFNETKILTMRSVLSSFFSSSKLKEVEELEKLKLSSLGGSQVSLQDESILSSLNLPGLNDTSRMETDIKNSENLGKKSESKLFLAQFTIQNVTVEIQSRGRSIAELQIIGARTSFTVRPLDTSISFVIQSLLLVDAVQTFGPDFELLLASHKHVSVDSVSGSLRDSDPTSPLSPQSPSCSSPGPYAYTRTFPNQLPIPSQLHDALVTSLQAKRLHKTKTPTTFDSHTPLMDVDALITAELVLVHTDEDLAILSVQFNNLDLIANQETVLEILQFLQRAFPSNEEIPSQQLPKSEAIINTGRYRLQTSFDFHRLNVLLVRGIIGKDGNQCARKICCATASEARVNFAIHNNGDLVVDGSLGGLQMLNLTPEGQYHQRILSVGQDPLVDPSYNVFSHATTSSNITDDLLASSNAEALTFAFEKFAEYDSTKPPIFKLRMASVIYTHCPMFLVDLKKCISEFQAPLAVKLRSAAAQIAFGLVRQDGPSNTYRSPSGSLSGSLDRLNIDDEHGINYSETGGSERCNSVELDIVLDSPVIVLPKTRSSPEVLVANLGQITVSGNNGQKGSDNKNVRSSSFSRVKPTSSYTTPNISHMDSQDVEDREGISYNVFVCDISLYSLDLSEKWSMMDNLKYTFPTTNTASIMTAQELYHCDAATSKPILHNTVIQLNICYRDDPPFVNVMSDDLNHSTIFPMDDNKEPYFGPKLEFQGRVVNPLKVSLTPKQYSQILDSLNNITGGDDEFSANEISIEAHTTDTKMRWKKEFYAMHHAGKVPHVQLPLPSPTRSMDDSLPIFAAFEVPELIVELVLPDLQPKRKRRRKVNKEEIPLLSLSCSDLSFECDKQGFLTEMKLNLKSLTLEDTSVPASSPQRFLAMSNTSLKPDTSEGNNTNSSFVTTSGVFQNHSRYVSTSCPDIPKSIPMFIPETPPSFASNSHVRLESSSLPDHLDPSDIFTGRFFVGKMNSRNTSRSMGSKRHGSVFGRASDRGSEEKSGFYPVTPPPSPRTNTGGASERFVNLVQIQICLVDPKSPQFISKYHGTHKFVDVDFNALEILLTPETFTCLRQFFAEAGKQDKVEQEQKIVTTGGPNITLQGVVEETKSSVEDDRDTETKINVKALSVKIATKKSTLAEGRVTNVMCHLVNRGKNFFGVEGRLGSLRIKDVSPYAGKYPVKFTFQGQQALDFDYCRKQNDAKFRLQMSSVVCVHTNRFYTEFSSLISVLFGSLSSEDSHVSQNPNISKLSDDKSTPSKVRVSLDIQAGAPVLLFPYSATSRNLLVADLGHLSVRNKIVQEFQNVFCDRISVDLIEMDLFAAEVQYCGNFHMAQSSQDNLGSGVQKLWFLDKKCAVVKTVESTSFLKEKCALKLQVQRILNCADVDLTQAATSVEGTLSTVCCFLDPGKYKLIRGLLEFNIGEKLDIDPPQSTPMRGRLSSFASTINKENHATAISTKKELSIELDLVNVTLELVKESGDRLSRVDFVKSKFTFHNYSDGTRDVDLASQEILICDSRFKAKLDKESQNNEQSQNVFTNILQQSTATGTVNLPPQNQGPSSFQSSTHLQAEIHYRLTQRGSSSTIVLNNMRLMLILDWWMELRTFLSQKGPTPDPINIQNSEMNTEGPPYDEAKEKKLLASPLIKRSRRTSTPVTVSAGIVTKRAPILDIPDTTFELKVNVSNCELVVVEDPSVWDTNAIILKSTAVLNYKPHLERPVTCSLLQCELFSCILGLESDTALSILDPTDITFELVRKAKMETLGILDATLSPSNLAKVLRVQSPHLILRLSYNDMKMFVQLMERFSKQAQYHLLQATHPADLSVEEERPDSFQSKKSKLKPRVSLDDSSLQQLVSMGFTRLESEEALIACDGKLDDAALALSGSINSFELDSACRSSPTDVTFTSDDASSIDGSEASKTVAENTASGGGGDLSGIEIKCTFLSVCVIDDCKDADVPLLELNVNQLELGHNCVDNSGQAECVLGGDYFNRELSGWEPFLEQWKCTVGWKKNDLGQIGTPTPGSDFPPKAPALELSISSRQIMNFNLTSTLLNLYSTVSSNWSEEYDKQKVDKRRAPFVPFLLKNETGSELWFSTILPNNEDLLKQQRNLTTGSHIWSTSTSSSGDSTGWIHVSNGSCRPFSFEGRGKLRHRNSHQLKTHQLAVRVDGWQEIIPVSLDKVGTYFRVAKPTVVHGHASDLPYTRLVFEVILQGSAQKLVRVRSALLLKNCLNEPVELKLENTIIYPSFAKQQTGGSFLTQVKPGESYPIPLHSVWAQLWIRPTSEVKSPRTSQPSLYRYCENHLLGNTEDSLSFCYSLAENQLEPYRFCVAVQKDEFPADEDDLYLMPKMSFNAAAQYLQMSKKVNVVTLLSPLNIINLLPVEIFYEIKGKNIKEIVGPGKESCLTNVNTVEQVEIAFHLENFPHGSSINVSSSNNGSVSRLKVMDSQKRPLILTVRVTKGEGSSMSVYLSCPYWIVNKTGIPILCKQEGTSEEAAGQFQEHEVGRNVAPLLFSFPDQEGLPALTLRVGTKVHADSKPHWCRSLYLQNGMQVRKLCVAVPSPRTEIVYLVGIEIKNGRGRYRDCKLVTIAPRFTIDNRSSKEVQISQRHLVTSFFDLEAESTYLKLTPGCNLPFHWPRLDKDQLLCVRLADVKGSLWSGGFPIENVDSFHIPVRHWDGACNFLRVEIILQGPTYFIVLGDTDKLPPPFRVDNFSFVPILFHQTAVNEERLKLTAKAESCCPFAWDEPTQPPHLTLAAPGGTSVVLSMDTLGFASHLTYENFFYIAFTATFPCDDLSRTPTVGLESLQLVLDVEGVKVVLRQKEPGKRSQLWRVNADGLIEHEGSSAPREPRKPPSYGSIMVLDIAGAGPQPTQYTPLMLRKPDKRRASTQHWEFTKDGRLKCETLDNLYVQAKDGFGSSTDSQNQNGKTSIATWTMWSDVVLGPDQPICYSRTDTGIPAEQAVSRHKLRPGSGRLALNVDTDGPTRVLRIIDVENPPKSKMLHHEFEESDCNTVPKFLANINLRNGLGISIINCKPREELVYIRLSSLHLKYSDSKESEIVEATVDNFQIDNQLLEAEKSLAVYVVPSPRYEMHEFPEAPQPALQLSWQRMKSKLNAHVFKSWELTIKPLSVILEERLLLKLCHWIGLSEKFQSIEGLQESDFEVQKALTNATSLTAKRFYFGDLTLTLNQVRLSVLTSSKLGNDLAMIKRRLGLTLIRFEDAQVELDPFAKQHPFETFEFLFASLIKHYRDELLSQAAIILGSTDFLGNPLGFVNDVSVGVTGLIYEGSLGSLVKNVTHGLSNSAAKVTGSLGDGLGRTTLDEKHEEERRKIREDLNGSSGEHLVAGLRGLAHGIMGGITSLVAQSFDGAASDGITGFVAGMGKGIVGTVTKPAVGILDLATGAASAIRDSSRTSSRMMPERCRPPRVATGNGGLLPVYSDSASRGQELLYEVNDRNYKELFIGQETLISGPGRDLRVLVSSQAVIVFKPSKGNPIILKVPMSELIESRLVLLCDKKACIELVHRLPDERGGYGQLTRPQVSCESESVARRVVEQINYAKVLYEEMRHSQIEKPNSPIDY